MESKRGVDVSVKIFWRIKELLLNLGVKEKILIFSYLVGRR